MSFLQQNIDTLEEMQANIENKSFFYAWRLLACVAICAVLPFICVYLSSIESAYRHAWLISTLVICFSAMGYMGSTVIMFRNSPAQYDINNLLRKVQAQLYSADKWIEECEGNIKKVDDLNENYKTIVLKLQGDLAAAEIVIASQKEEITKLRNPNG